MLILEPGRLWAATVAVTEPAPRQGVAVAATSVPAAAAQGALNVAAAQGAAKPAAQAPTAARGAAEDVVGAVARRRINRWTCS